MSSSSDMILLSVIQSRQYQVKDDNLGCYDLRYLLKQFPWFSRTFLQPQNRLKVQLSQWQLFPGEIPTFYIITCGAYGTAEVDRNQLIQPFHYCNNFPLQAIIFGNTKKLWYGGQRSANRRQLVVQAGRRSKFGRRSFSVAAPMVWNSFPDSLRDQTLSIDNFRSTLKTHLFAAQRDT